MEVAPSLPSSAKGAGCPGPQLRADALLTGSGSMSPGPSPRGTSTRPRRRSSHWRMHRGSRPGSASRASPPGSHGCSTWTLPPRSGTTDMRSERWWTSAQACGGLDQQTAPTIRAQEEKRGSCSQERMMGWEGDLGLRYQPFPWALHPGAGHRHSWGALATAGRPRAGQDGAPSPQRPLPC